MRRFRKPSAIDEVGGFAWHVERGTGRRVVWIAVPCRELESERGFVLTRWTIDHPNHCGAKWSWDGNEDAPTLYPSLHAVGTWHGWCRAGELIEA